MPAYVVHGAAARVPDRDPRRRRASRPRTIGRDAELGALQRAYRDTVAPARARGRHRRRRGRHREVAPALRVRQLARAAPGERVLLRRARPYANRTRSPFALIRSVLTTRFDILDSDDAPTVRRSPRRVRRHARRARRRSRHALGRSRQRPRRRRPRARRLRRPPDRGPGPPGGLVPHPRRRPAGHDAARGSPLGRRRVARPARAPRRAGRRRAAAPRRRHPPGARHPPGVAERRRPCGSTGCRPRPPPSSCARCSSTSSTCPTTLVALVARRRRRQRLLRRGAGVDAHRRAGHRHRRHRRRLADRPRTVRRRRIPATLTAVLLARLDGLAPEQRRALQHAAVVGRIFWDAAFHLKSRRSCTW